MIMRRYYSKILLFGEYTVLDGSAAVAIPFTKYGGDWIITKNGSYDHGLSKLKKYLSIKYYDGAIDHVDFDQFERDLSRGLKFESTVPTGYGLGSSGALVAGFFDKYMQKKEQYSLLQLKQLLGLIESCFHGNSSGIDPLVSYLNMPILSHPDGDIELLDKDRSGFLSNMKLLDTGMSRQTAPLVEAYKHTKKVVNSFDDATKEIAEITDEVIVAYILGDFSIFVAAIKRLSEKQLITLPMLIPEKYQKLWATGLEQEAFCMKLCGAGHGGCMLLYILDEEKSSFILQGEKVIQLKP